MHVPDGFLDVPTSVGTGAVAVTAVAVALRQAKTELDERTTPVAGLVAAFVFAAQMVNFPVGIGTSGHLIGGALAAALVGPATAVLCLTVVLLVQSLLMADGGLTALGTNVTLLAVTTVVVGWALTRLVVAVLPKRPESAATAAAIGAGGSVIAASAVFVGLYAIGGTTPLSLPALTAAMLGVHLVIGVAEAAITFLTISALLRVRPDLVYVARGLIPPRPLEVRTP